MSKVRETTNSINEDLRQVVGRIEVEFGAHPAFTKAQTLIASAQHTLALHCDGLWRENEDAERKSAAIELLEGRIKDLEQRNTDLLIHNNELLARARKAEGVLRDHNLTV